ncbi:MAG TPA: ATP-binding protein [Gammaproteobacteria bacterium]|nr:ATP-binding protein [Gammaproteobacteria bacterium]
MPRADLLINLVKAESKGDRNAFRRSLEALIVEEREKKHNVLAERLAEYLRNTNANESKVITTQNWDSNLQSILLELVPEKSMDDLIIPGVVRHACDEVVEEQHRVELLRSYNLEPRHRILLAGAPGNGKTSLAEALAHALMAPLLVVRYEGIIGSYLGETAQKLKKLFDYVRERRCVLFFDEFDTIGKERGDVHETGEIKRVVSSLLLQMDSLPSHVVVVTASNHPELLDRAVWRRFQLRMELPLPAKSSIAEWLRRLQKEFDEPLDLSVDVVADKLKGLSFAELEEFGLDIRRRYVLSAPDADLKKIVLNRLIEYQARYQPE